MHSYDDALFACNRSRLDLTDLRIIDVAPSLLSGLGLAVPAAMDGTDRGVTTS